MNTQLKLVKAKSQLSSKHPYFGMLATRLKHEEDSKVTTFASNGIKFIYNPSFIEKCSMDEIFFILTNCVMHHILAHSQRKLDRKGFLWQLATDYAINSMLKKNKFRIPDGANFNNDFRNMYAEEIYEILKKQLQEQNGNSSYDDAKLLDSFIKKNNGNLNLFDSLKKMAPKEIEQWDYAASLANEIASKKSSKPLGFERFAKKMKTNNIDWKFELYNAINRHMRNNYAFMPPNKKHIYRGVALPSLTSDTLSLVVAIDTSGSIKEDILGAFISEFKSIMQNFPTISIELLIADAKVHHHYSFSACDEMDFDLRGGGGTDYRPVFEYIDANISHSSMLLYFTDGEGIFPKITPNYEVLWALSQNRAKIPFGKSIHIFG
jgi:predicted metal-dependent peptidase